MLYYDVSKASRQSHRSGLTRMSGCLAAALKRARPDGVCEVVWSERRGCFLGTSNRKRIEPMSEDWLLSPELFSDGERPAFRNWLCEAGCRTAAVFYDAIPLKHPEICWPQSVARHPSYMKMLAAFDRVLAISRASAVELAGYWEWAGVHHEAPVAVQLGADGHGRERRTVDPGRAGMRKLVMVGIIEPRKNQEAVLDACEALWSEGATCSLEVFGRVNPHFGKPTEKRMRAMARAGRPVRFKAGADDAEITAALAGARALLMPSIAEGCGLPVLEALWNGVPAVCSDLPAFLESAEGGGSVVVRAGDQQALTDGLRNLLADDALVTRLTGEACSRPLPTWDQTAAEVLSALGNPQ